GRHLGQRLLARDRRRRTRRSGPDAQAGLISDTRCGPAAPRPPDNGHCSRPDVATANQSADALRLTRAGWKIVILASLGGTLEFYDFVVFGVFARDIAAAMFPAGSL